MARVQLSYGEVEEILVAMNRVSSNKRVAFAARLKHLQRLGFPPGVNTGTGKRAIYTFPKLLMMAFAIEFAQAGMTPKRIIKTLGSNWNEVETSLLVAMTLEDEFGRWNPPLETNELVWMLSPEAMRDLTEEGDGEHDYYESIRVEKVADVSSILLDYEKGRPLVGEFYRHLIIQLHPFLIVLLSKIHEVLPALALVDIYQDLADHLAERGRAQRDMLATVDIQVKRDGDDPEA